MESFLANVKDLSRKIDLGSSLDKFARAMSSCFCIAMEGGSTEQ
jgi:hypothetical protein